MNFDKFNFEFSVTAGFTETNIREIYEGGIPSSIVLRSQMSLAWAPLYKRFNGKFHPVDWYSHCPNTSIAYLTAFGSTLPDTGKIVARTIVYHNEDGKPIQYGPMYAGDSMFDAILSHLLHEQDIHNLDWSNRWLVTKPFTMKGFRYNENNGPWLCPFPFLDVLRGPYYHVSDDGTFTFGCENDLVDMGLTRCYPTHSLGPSHYGILASNMRNGLPSDNEWMKKFSRD